jgi:hypothetical protein
MLDERQQKAPSPATPICCADRLAFFRSNSFPIAIDPFFIVVEARCERCQVLGSELSASRERVAALEQDLARLTAQITETTKLIELQQADIDRYRKLYEKVQPNTPERVPKDQLQLAFARVLASMSDLDAAKELYDLARAPVARRSESCQRAA